MNQPSPEFPDERLITLKFIADHLGLSVREVNRNKNTWAGFPPVVDMGYKTKRYSHLAFQAWLKEFIKEKTVKTKDTP